MLLVMTGGRFEGDEAVVSVVVFEAVGITPFSGMRILG